MNAIDTRPIDTHIRRAGLIRTVALAESIADLVVMALAGMRRARQALSRLAHVDVHPPKEYSTAMPRRF